MELDNNGNKELELLQEKNSNNKIIDRNQIISFMTDYLFCLKIKIYDIIIYIYGGFYGKFRT